VNSVQIFQILNDALVPPPAHLKATAQHTDFRLFKMFVFLKLNLLEFCFCIVVVKQFDYCLYLKLRVSVDIVHISEYLKRSVKWENETLIELFNKN